MIFIALVDNAPKLAAGVDDEVVTGMVAILLGTGRALSDVSRFAGAGDFLQIFKFFDTNFHAE